MMRVRPADSRTKASHADNVVRAREAFYGEDDVYDEDRRRDRRRRGERSPAPGGRQAYRRQRRRGPTFRELCVVEGGKRVRYVLQELHPIPASVRLKGADDVSPQFVRTVIIP